LIVDRLRREGRGESRDISLRDQRISGVPDTQRYSRRASWRGLPAEQIIGIAAGAMAIGFLAVALPAFWAARQTKPRPSAARPLVRPVLRRPSPAPPAQDTLLLDRNDATAEVHNNLGVSYLLARELDTAAAELNVALGINPGGIEALVNLALVERAAGRTAEAGDLLRRAVAADPRHAASHYNLAIVADEGGDIATAVTHYRAFLHYGSLDYPELADRVRPRLTALESG
jgi:tetratricopeptide (TPR) repeat protein